MDVPDAPQWLIGEWTRTCRRAGATADDEQVKLAGEQLIRRWMQPGRHFHNVRHLADVLARVDELERESHEPDLVRLAAWYHGAIFDADADASYSERGGEDEEASAALARTDLSSLGMSPERANRVATLVTALRRHTPEAEDVDCQVLCDADLSMLAGDPQRYRTYLKEVREEYAHLPVEAFVRARIKILRKLLDRDALFQSPMGTAWEAPARQNIQAELHRLEKELAALDETQAKAQAQPTDVEPQTGDSDPSATGPSQA